MKLYSSPATPFGRKAAIVAREHGIALDIVNVNPFESEELERLNPIKLIPVLVLDDGTVLYDSHAICAYLDETGDGPTFYPEAERLDWQRRMALGTALTETSVLLLFQKRLPADQQSDRLKSHYTQRVGAHPGRAGGRGGGSRRRTVPHGPHRGALRCRPPRVPPRRGLAGGLPGAGPRGTRACGAGPASPRPCPPTEPTD